jgi:S-formylglutathione hydrolase FrmB
MRRLPRGVLLRAAVLITAAPVTLGAPATAASAATFALPRPHAMPASAAVQQQAADGDARVTGQRSLGGRGLELTIETSAFTSPVAVRVFLPVGYASQPGRRWPVVYYTAGTTHTERSFDEIYDGETLTRDFPAIFVAPRGDSGYWSDWYNTGAGGPPKYETFVIDQLLPLVDRMFRTVGTREGRAIMGESMGGYGTLMFAARHPDQFIAASSLSGAVDTNQAGITAAVSASPALQNEEPDSIYGPRPVQEVRWRGHNPWDLAENLRHVDVQLRTANGQGIDPSIGETPNDVPSCAIEVGVYGASVSLHNRLTALGIEHTWRDYGTGCHTVPNFQRQIKDSLARFQQILLRKVSPEHFTQLAIEPEFHVWGWQVKTDPKRALEFLRLENASARGVTLIGSGTTAVTTAALFKDKVAVDVIAGTSRTRVKPDANGRLTFPVSLGAANTQQQYTTASRSPTTAQQVLFRVPATAPNASAPSATAGGTTASRAVPAGAQLPATGLETMPALTAAWLVALGLAGARLRRNRV